MPAAFGALAARLAGAFDDLASDWPWPESVVTYENALLPRALIAAASRLGDEGMLRDRLPGARLADGGSDDRLGPALPGG